MRTRGYQCAAHRVNEQLCATDNPRRGACGLLPGSVGSALMFRAFVVVPIVIVASIEAGEGGAHR
jgi:hypothetical protein